MRKILGLTGSIATGDSTHWGTNDTDYINQYLTGVDQSSLDPVTIATTTTFNSGKLIATSPSFTTPVFSSISNTGTITLPTITDTLVGRATTDTYTGAKTFGNQLLKLRNPASTFTSTVINPAITADSNFQFNVPYDYYIFIDPDDSNKIKARNGRTGAIDYSDSTNADVVINGAINSLSANSTQTASAGANQYLWTGGQYGTIFVGPGTFNVSNSIILKSNITIRGSGPWATVFKLIAQHADNSNSIVMKSSQWDTLSAPNTPTATQQQQGDKGVRLMHFAIDGNRINNQSTVTTVQTTQMVIGVETVTQSWGHGIAFYGAGLYIQDLWVQFCRGAGIVVEDGAQNLGGITGTSPTAVETHGDPWCAKIRDIYVRGNDQQGILVRGPLTSIKGVTTAYNGEGGIDVQTSQYFAGALGELSDGILFLDCNNHVNDAMTTYNPRLFELRLTGNENNVHDIWIEGPSGPGDCVHLGIETNSDTATGNSLGGVLSYSHMDNIIMDNIHYNGIYMGKSCYRNHLSNIKLKAQNEIGTGAFQNGMQCNAQFGNWIDIEIRDLPFPTDTTNHHAAVILGDASNIANRNHIKLSAMSCQYDLKWGNASNYGNTIEVVHTHKTDFAASLGLLDPNSVSIDYTKNNIKVIASPFTGGTSDIVGFMGSNGGLATITGSTGVTAYTISHGLYTQPNVVEVIPANSAAVTAGTYYVTVQPTTITINFTTAPGNATSNQFYWNARVNYQ